MICIGYTGYEAFDVILYTGRVLTKLNKRVLMIDLSKSGALRQSIHHGMGLDSLKEIVTYRDISYLQRLPSKNELEEFQEGIVMINYGMNYNEQFPVELHQINLVVNTYPHIIEAVCRLSEEIIMNHSRCNLLIRDARSIDDVDYVAEAIIPPDKFHRISYLYHNITDFESAVDCQLTKSVRLSKISSRMKRCIIQQVKDIYPLLKEDKICKAMLAAKRGA